MRGLRWQLGSVRTLLFPKGGQIFGWLAGLLVQVYFSAPQLPFAADELPRAYALYRVGRQRRYRNAPVIRRFAPFFEPEVPVVKSVFLPDGGKVARVGGDYVQEELRLRVIRRAGLFEVDKDVFVLAFIKIDVKV